VIERKEGTNMNEAKMVSRETLITQLESKLQRKNQILKILEDCSVLNPMSAMHQQLTILERSITELIVAIGGKKLGVELVDNSKYTIEELLEIIRGGKVEDDKATE